MKRQYNRWPTMLLLVLATLIGSCEKEDYTLPVEFVLDFTIKNETILDTTISIDEISLELNTIDIRGYREQADDVFLTRDFEQGKSFLIRAGSTNIKEKLDIPQGIYKPLAFSFIFKPDTEENDLIEDIVEWHENLENGDAPEDLKEELGDIIESYLSDISPCIVMKGKFTYNNHTKNLLLVINDPLNYQIHGENKTGGSEVTLNKNFVNTGNLRFNPAYWFSAVTAAMLNDAFIGVIDGKEYIFLSKHVNSRIYETIFNRMEESTTLAINE